MVSDCCPIDDRSVGINQILWFDQSIEDQINEENDPGMHHDERNCATKWRIIKKQSALNISTIKFYSTNDVTKQNIIVLWSTIEQLASN